MAACFEKSDENAKFHQIVDFLSTCSVNYALIVSPTIYASYIERFWSTATSKIINSVKQIHAIVDGKAIVISESSLRSDLLFNDEGGVTCLTNDEIFENLALIGYEQLLTKLTFQKDPQIASLHIETSPTAAPQTEAHQTAVSQIVFHEAHIEQILPSPTTYQRKRKTQKCRRTEKDTELPQTSVPLDHGADETRYERVLTQPNELPLLEGHTSRSGKGRMELTFELTDNAPSTSHNSPLLGGYTPGSDERRMKLDELITLCTKLSKQLLDLEKEKDAQDVEILELKRRDESKQGRRSDKLKTMFNDKDFEELDDYMENVEDETVDAAATGVSTVSAPVSTVGVTITQTLIKMKGQKAKEKGVAITDVEDSSRIVRPVRSVTTLQPLPTIDPKDKGKGVLVEEEPVKIKMRDQGDLQVQADAELAQRLHEEELAELERAQQERQRQEDDTNAALAKEFDEIQARIDVDHELALWSSYITDGWYFDLLQHASREKVSSMKEMLQKMLDWKLEAEVESTMAFELLKFIKSQLEE
ncbi:hypothetical protein Tco_0573288 [Tanacetum coccineum]